MIALMSYALSGHPCYSVLYQGRVILLKNLSVFKYLFYTAYVTCGDSLILTEEDVRWRRIANYIH